jgi:hypothetical protein
MKIAAFYYLKYPDCSPLDRLIAASEVYVEVQESDDSPYDFDSCYSINVCTIGYVQQILKENPYYLAHRTLIVKRFDDSEIKKTIESILPRIGDFGLRQ